MVLCLLATFGVCNAAALLHCFDVCLFQYASKLQAESEGRVRAEEQLVSVRSSLVQGIAGDDADPTLYRHAPLADLVRLYGKEKAEAAPARPWSRSSRPASRASASRRSPLPGEPAGNETGAGDGDLDGTATRSAEEHGGGGDADDEDAAAAFRVEQSLDRDAVLKAARAHNFQLSKRLEEAEARERELQDVASQTDAAQQKAMVFASKLRSATNRAGRAEKAAASAEARVDALSQHVEKLMTHLEHEAGAKAKLHDQLRRADHTIARLKERGAQLARANQQRDRLILELKVSQSTLGLPLQPAVRCRRRGCGMAGYQLLVEYVVPIASCRREPRFSRISFG
jgi:hypothetical protein